MSLQNVNFQNFFTARKKMKIPLKRVYKFPLQLKHVATLPCEMRTLENRPKNDNETLGY